MKATIRPRRLPVGAEPVAGAGVEFRVWAPGRKTVAVVLEGGPGSETNDGPPVIGLKREHGGYFSGRAARARAGTLYRFRLDDGDRLYPDPASREQPDGPHGPSRVVDPSAFRWTDRSWPGPGLEGSVFYEMHIGTFTPEGTWRAAIDQLPALADLGATVLEIMPVIEVPGRFNWGYDGVHIFAPTRNYGEPDDMRAFIDRAHALGLAVILDVCFSHLGPDGNYLGAFTPRFFTDRYENDWGKPFNFDGEQSGPVREFVLSNAAYWVEEFHADGLRIDATQDTKDESPGEHILTAMARMVREAARGRRTLVVGENEPQEARLIRPLERGGLGLDALWADDFHHAAIVAATGRREAYYADYLGAPQEFVSVAKRGYLYQGQINTRQGKRRGSPTAGLEPWRFITYLGEPRPGRQLAPGRAPPPDRRPRPLPGIDGPAPARAGHPPAVPGAGVRRDEPVPLFQRLWARSRRVDVPGPPGLPLAVRRPGDGRGEGPDPSARRPGDLRPLEARPVRARAARRGIRLAS